jgi:hypothetical protein
MTGSSTAELKKSNCRGGGSGGTATITYGDSPGLRHGGGAGASSAGHSCVPYKQRPVSGQWLAFNGLRDAALMQRAARRRPSGSIMAGSVAGVLR